MKLLFVITGLAYGGAETQVVQLAQTFSKKGWEVKLATLVQPRAYAEDLIRQGIHVEWLRVRRKCPDPRPIVSLAILIHTWRPQIVHSHMVHANILTRLTRLFAPIPVLICTAHSIDERGRKGSGRLRTFLYRLTDPLCDLTTQVSYVGLERYIRIGAVPRRKIRYIPNGVDTERFAPNPEIRVQMRKEFGFDNEFVWLAVGRFDPQKDYATMLYAFANAMKKYPNTYLLIAGDGPLRHSIEALAQALGIIEHVRFLGIRRDISELMNAADGYLLSSVWEGMPMVLLEAHAVGLPIVATDVGGNREVVRDGKTGLLVPPKNPEALAQAMLRLMQLSKNERQRMGREGRKHVEENFNIERVVNMWEALYRELLAKKGVKTG